MEFSGNTQSWNLVRISNENKMEAVPVESIVMLVYVCHDVFYNSGDLYPSTFQN